MWQWPFAGKGRGMWKWPFTGKVGGKGNYSMSRRMWYWIFRAKPVGNDFLQEREVGGSHS